MEAVVVDGVAGVGVNTHIATRPTNVIPHQ